MNLDLDVLNASLEDASTEEVLGWALDTFDGEIALSSSFQTQSVPLLHLIALLAPELPVLFLDTGYHFPETLAFRDRLAGQLGLNLVVIEPDGDSRPVAFPDGGPLYLADPDLCCELHKVEPMRRAMQSYQGWISGIRRDQSASRRDVRVIEHTPDGRYRIHPMLHWSGRDVQAYLQKHRLPEHPLSALGYPSIGCAPCTCKPQASGDDRGGRWVGHHKCECGLHTILRGKAKSSS